MKTVFSVMMFFLTLSLFSQTLSPSIITYDKTTYISDPNDSGKTNYFFPFRGEKGALAEIFDYDGRIFNSLQGIAIRTSLDTSNANSVFVEYVSIVPWNLFRVALGSNLSYVDLKDSTRTAQEIAFQKLTNGGGNIILNLSRPLIYFPNVGSGYIVLNGDITGYADISGVNQNIYNPGWGVLTNFNLDYRVYDYGIGEGEGKNGNIFRFGFNLRNQYSLFNRRYENNNAIDARFNNLSISTFGLYLGLAMFNFQLGYNMYNKSDRFLNDKKFLLRIEVVPVKF